jgi:N-acetylglutamate synthase-like GNAT family acetyltransferase
VPTEIRDADASDQDAIVQVHNATWRRAYRNLFPDEYLDGDELLARQQTDWQRRFGADGKDYPVRVAVDNGKVIGFAAWEIDTKNVAELAAIYVHPSHWSTGAGSSLLRDARDQWKANGVKQAFAWVAVDSARAHRSYKKNGWEITDEESVRNIDGHDVSVHKLTLEL